jgi:hypothetical protein
MTVRQTLKNMMKTFCLDSQKDWDGGICMLLFVVKEAFHESLSLILLMLLVPTKVEPKYLEP